MNSVKNSPTLEFEKNSDVGLKIAKVIAFVLVLNFCEGTGSERRQVRLALLST